MSHEITVRVPGYAQAQINAGTSLHPVRGHHRIIETRRMVVISHVGNRYRVIDSDGKLIEMDESFYAAFATPVPEPPVKPVTAKRGKSKVTDEKPAVEPVDAKPAALDDED